MILCAAILLVILILAAIFHSPCKIVTIHPSDNLSRAKWFFGVDFKDLGLSNDEVPIFMQWAFGDRWDVSDHSALAERWNERHGDIFSIKGYESISETTKRMIEVWMTQRARI